MNGNIEIDELYIRLSVVHGPFTPPRQLAKIIVRKSYNKNKDHIERLGIVSNDTLFFECNININLKHIME